MSVTPAIEATVREVLTVGLGRPIGPDERPTRASEPAWDSLKHIELVFLLESELDVTFTPDEMAELDSLDAIAAMVQAKRAP
jgi:acyl carrier protein